MPQLELERLDDAPSLENWVQELVRGSWVLPASACARVVVLHVRRLSAGGCPYLRQLGAGAGEPGSRLLPADPVPAGVVGTRRDCLGEHASGTPQALATRSSPSLLLHHPLHAPCLYHTTHLLAA